MYDFDHKTFDKMRLINNINHFLGSLSLELLQKITYLSYEKYHYKFDYYYERPDVFCQILREACGTSYVNLLESTCITIQSDL